MLRSILLVGNIPFLILFLWNAHNLTWKQFFAGRDFGNFYLAGNLADVGAIGSIFHPKIFQHLLLENFPFWDPPRLFSYPPTELYLDDLIGHLPLGAAWLVFTTLGVVLLIFWARSGLSSKAGEYGYLIVLACPAVFDNTIVSGQNGLITAALLGLGLLYMQRLPIWSGICLSILTFKPQLLIVMPATMLANRAWIAIVVAIAGTATLVGSSILVFPGAWPLWIHDVIPAQNLMMDAQVVPTRVQMMTCNIFVVLHSMIGKAMLARHLQYAVAMLACIAAAFVWLRPEPDISGHACPVKTENMRRIAITFALGEAAATWSLNYDLVGLQVALVMYYLLADEAARRQAYRFPGYERLAILFSLGTESWFYFFSLLTHTVPMTFLVYLVPAVALSVGEFSLTFAYFFDRSDRIAEPRRKIFAR